MISKYLKNSNVYFVIHINQSDSFSVREKAGVFQMIEIHLIRKNSSYFYYNAQIEGYLGLLDRPKI